MTNFITRKSFLVPSFDLDVKETEKLDRFLLILNDSGVDKLISNKEFLIPENGGRPSYSPYDLFATILYGFAFGSSTLRELETSCKYDLRYFYLMQQERPSHIRFGKFINDIILPNRDEIFHLLTNQIIQECNLSVEDVFIDGSKFEADANKYKFVWKPTTFHLRLSDKIRNLLEKVNLSRGIPKSGFIDSKLIAQKISILSANGEFDKEYKLLCNYLIKTLEYEEKERICGDRNSYYKTDHDATAMTLKSDYYSGLGSNMRAAYNCQLLVSSGIICTYYVSQSRSDTNDFVPILRRFRTYYGYHPKRVCADAAYGSLENYRYLDVNGIENYVKYYSWEGNVSGRNPDQYIWNDNHTITCLNGLTGYITDIPFRHPKKAEAVFYRVDGCNAGCQFNAYCKRWMKDKNENYKIFEVVEELQKYKNQSFANLLSPKGIEMRVNRSTQVEGAFGVIKEDMNYTRLRRTQMEKVETEFMLTYLGYNLRKLFRHFDNKAKFIYWSAPENLVPEKMKKPSAKRLSNKAKKNTSKASNQISKKSYKYK
ncbi:MAG: transposase [Methanobrevibacter sp.]|nr:transposase [Methanobrevibacter sp.]